LGIWTVVVIPWRGFRCFTHYEKGDRQCASDVLHVVIPWRGFRCFTLRGPIGYRQAGYFGRCNPLAGI